MGRRILALGMMGLLLVGLLLMASPAWAIKVSIIPSIQQSNHSPDYTYVEGTGMNDTAAKLASKLAARGFEVRNSAYTFSTVNAACYDAAAWGANCCISNHTNASAANDTGWHSQRGTQTFYLVNWGGYSSPGDIDIAQRCGSKLVQKFGYWGRGYNGAAYSVNQGDFVWNAPGDHALVEGLFHDNWDDLQVLNLDQGRLAYADGVYEAVCDHYGWSYGPPFTFDTGIQNWTPGNSASAISWAGPDWTWPGCMFFDQTGNDSNVYSPGLTLTGMAEPQLINVSLFPQGGTPSAHDMQMFWKTNADNTWNAAKSTPIVNYTVTDGWVNLNLDVNSSYWWNQAVNQFRLDTDQTNHSTRWIVNHVAVQSQPYYDFNSSTMGWTSVNGLAAPVWYSDGFWGTIMYVDQTGLDPYMVSPVIGNDATHPYRFIGAVNDKIHIRLYPQTVQTSHDIQFFWITETDGTWGSNGKYLGQYNYTGQSQWIDIYIPVGSNSAWSGQQIKQLRVDFDHGHNDGTRWIVDYIRLESGGNQLAVPGTPTGLAGNSTGTTTTHLSWTAATTTDGSSIACYEIQRGGVAVATVTGTTFDDSGLTANTQYSYRVRAMSNYNLWGSLCAAVNVTTAGGVPTTPTMTATATGQTTANLSWTAATVTDGSGIANYEIYRNGVSLTTVSGTTTTFGDTGLTQGTQYTYKVRAKSGNNVWGSFSADAVTTTWSVPTTPTTSATATGLNTTSISWSAATVTDGSGIANYEVYRNGALLTTVSGATNSTTDSGLAENTQYTYKVRAKSGNNVWGAYSADSATTTWSTPTVPGSVVATSSDYNVARVTWSASTSADGSGISNYEIWRNGAALTTVAGTATSFDDSGLTQGTSYSYQVRAKNGHNTWSGLSATFSVKTWSLLLNDPFANLNNWTASKVADGTTRGCTLDTTTGSPYGSGSPAAKASYGSGTNNGCYSYNGVSGATTFAVGYIEARVYDAATTGNARHGIGFRKSTNDDIATPRVVYFMGTEPYSTTTYNCEVYGLSGGWVKHSTGGSRLIDWNLFRVAIDGTNVKFYRGGSLVDTIAEPAEKTDGVNRWYIGSNYDTTINGWYDDFKACMPTPPAPTATAATGQTTTSVTWNWTRGPSDYEQGFYIKDTSGTIKGTVGRGVTSFTETGLTRNTLYTRVISAYNGTLESSGSQVATSTSP